MIPNKEDHVCLLKRSLYGLKQSPRQWYKRFDAFMLEHDFLMSQYDSCVYFKQLLDGSFMYLLIYVDDMLIVGKDMYKINKIKAQLSGEFEIKDLGAAKKILGIEIRKNREVGQLYLSQKNYFERVLKRFGMQDAKLVSIPLVTHFKLSAELSPQIEQETEYVSHVPYASAVGSLMYGMVCTRPNISYVVSVVSRYMGNSGNAH